jgi:hypothetical protein
MPAKSPEERSLVSRIGGYEKWAKTADRTAATQAARRAFEKRFEQYPDPEAARKAYFARLALKSAQAVGRRRRERRTGVARPRSSLLG